MGFVILFFLYLMACAAIANWAAARGRDFWTVFFIGLAISPLFIIVPIWNPFRSRKSPLLK